MPVGHTLWSLIRHFVVVMRSVLVFLGMAAVGVCAPNELSTTNLLSYISMHPGQSIDGKYDCIGDCTTENLCYVSWHNAVASCRSDAKTRTLRYNTLNGKRCISDCHKFYDYKTEWCVTEGLGWGYCSRRTAKFGYRVERSNDPLAVCADDCSKRTSSYNWCNTVSGKWDYCTPGSLTHVYDYLAENGKTCIGTCGREDKFVESYYYCYTAGNEWSKCYPDPTPQLSYFEKINDAIRYNCSLYQDSAAGLFRCRNGRRVTKRHTSPNEFNYDNCGADIEDLLLIHQLFFPDITVRPWNPLNPITTDTNPIIEYYVHQTLSYFDDFHDIGVHLPMNVRAVITQHTLDNRREAFNTSTTNNFFAQDVGLNRPSDDYDERGHMIAARLGGSAAPFNIFPQTRTMNRGTGSLWNSMERQIEAFVRSEPNHRYVHMTVALSYDVNIDMTIIHRPIGVAVRLEAHDTRTGSTFYDIATLTPVPPGQPNPHRNMFFSNEDNSACPPPTNNG